MKTETETETKYDIEILALAEFLNIDPSEVSEERYDHYDMRVFSADGGEYAVANDSEADNAWDQSLESYLEECVYPELPDPLKNYFDDEAWKHDARYDGRGHSLSSYDGKENEVKIGDEWFFIYRTN